MKKQNRILALVAMIFVIGTMVALPCFATGTSIPDGSEEKLAYNVTFDYLYENEGNIVRYYDTTPTYYANDGQISAQTFGVTGSSTDGYVFSTLDYFNDKTVDFTISVAPVVITYEDELPHLEYRNLDYPTQYRYSYDCYTTDGRWLFGADAMGTLALSTFNLADYITIPEGTNYIYLNKFEVYGFADQDPNMSAVVGPAGFTTIAPISGDNMIVRDVTDVDEVGNFLWNSVTGFLRFEIAEGIQLYEVLLALIALPLLMWFLKLVAGG